MKLAYRSIGFLVFVMVVMAAAVAGRQLGAREARVEIARALGLDKPDRVHIKSVSTTGSDAIVEASFDGAFHMKANKDGGWTVTEVRTGDRCWESIENIRDAIKKEKILRTAADLRTIAAGLEAFRRERGFYVLANNSGALIDNLSPRYIGSVLRLDAWSREFAYAGTAGSYRLASAGPDGKPGTADDLVVENGKLVQGAEQ
ncbi:MAG TPA: type II secretion system protein GspG [Blastocatellia bacterium]|nr:type II secretion system protein GspG [Blastocatellia bacterium]